ncbi:ABC transporter ATP-binding protein [Marinomonas dokdonensis]|uniref:ABC transporter ATP-binding protein n=1 Tax=Marinomonas dokdonensis TaxID=328224 RepID=UPI00405563A4
MCDDISISLENVSLYYRIFEKIDYNEKKMTSELGGHFQKRKNKVVIKALDNVSFTVRKGERVGILGHNGAGKSTLLRTMAGIYQPQEGKVYRKGIVSAVFDKMMGMDQELSGKENIFGRGVFLGQTKREIQNIYEEIVNFTGLAEHINMPIKYYSPGMKARLGFAISTSFKPDILLLDEWLGVGDASFQEKARERMKNFVEEAGTVVLASHNMKLIERNCDRIITFSKGKLIEA